MKLIRKIQYVLLSASLLFSQVGYTQGEVREDLIQNGASLLEQSATTDDFIAKAREMSAQKPFSPSEIGYLRDLNEKLPASERNKLCPTEGQGLCASFFDLGPAPTNEVFSQVEAPAARSTTSESTLSGISPYWVASGLIALILYQTLKDKELQIQFGGSFR